MKSPVASRPLSPPTTSSRSKTPPPQQKGISDLIELCKSPASPVACRPLSAHEDLLEDLEPVDSHDTTEQVQECQVDSSDLSSDMVSCLFFVKVKTYKLIICLCKYDLNNFFCPSQNILFHKHWCGILEFPFI
jgi:hypothetical protein